MISLGECIDLVANSQTITQMGRVEEYTGSVVVCDGPDVCVGDVCEILPLGQHKSVRAEVIGFRDGKVLCLPYTSMQGIGPGAKVKAYHQPTSIAVSEDMIGRVLDAFGQPIDGKGPIVAKQEMPLLPEPMNPLTRQLIKTPLSTGVGIIDSCLPLGKGQRVGIFAGSGVGKSTLLAMIAKHSSADINVIALVGERGREVEEFIEETLGESGMANTVIVVATADSLPLVRVNAAYSATAIAEYFSDQGKDVMLIMDSVTRFATAYRDIGLSRGEPPTARGYTPSTFSVVPALIERTGNFKQRGSITGVYSVLVEGDDFNEPVSDALRAVLDGHIMLTRDLANFGQFPAVSVLNSVSRLASKVSSKEHRRCADKIRQLLAIYEENRDRIAIGAYSPGQDKLLDLAVDVMPKMIELLKQDPDDKADLEKLLLALNTLVLKV